MVAQRTVTIMPPSLHYLQEMKKEQTRRLRVAAYCRVSTDEEEQQSSYENQLEYYTELITTKENWKMAGIFADEGITGTSTRKRADFLRLMELCKKGKVDLILVKSISRFARNTLDCLSYVRMLKDHDVAVIFEKEGINTREMTSEVMLTFCGAFAQAESESISGNIKWGKRKSYKDGKVTFQYSRFYGYERGEDGQPKSVPEQAEIVKRIFYSYLAGSSVAQIKRELESEEIPSSTGKPEWSIGVLQYMLKNEKYIGDAILQKTYIVDCISKKVKKNSGELPMYYVEGNHAGIIDKNIFHRVQEEMARRSGKQKVSQKKTKTENGKYSGKYALSELLVCGECGANYRRVTWARGGKKKIVWRCINRLELGTKYCKESPSIEEDQLHAAILEAMNQIMCNKDEIAEMIANAKEFVRLALQGEGGFDKAAAEERIGELQAEMLRLVDETIKSTEAADFYENRFKELSGEIKQLQDALQLNEEQQVKAQQSDAKLGHLLSIIEQDDFTITEYTEATARQLLEAVKVIDNNKLLVVFKDRLCEIEVAL